MATNFLKDFDGLLQSILVDYENLDPEPDTSKGSMTFISAACLASCLWGIYKYQDYIANQIFPDIADSNNLSHWGSIYNLTRQPVENADGTMGVESDPVFLARLLQTLRQPPAGGNKYDWANWCMFYPNGNRIVTTVNLDAYGNGYYFTNVQVSTPSAGVVSLVVTPNDGTLSTAALAELHSLADTNIEALRPVTANNYTLYDPVIVTLSVWLKIDAASYTTTLANTITTDVTNFLNSVVPGQAIYQAKLSAIAINDGCNGCDVLDPATDIYVTPYQQIKAGTVVVQSM